MTNYFKRWRSVLIHIVEAAGYKPVVAEPAQATANHYSPWLALFSVALMLSAAGRAAEATEPAAINLTIKAHRFEPAELTVPANTKVRLLVKNADPTPEEFESYELNREKVVPGNSELVLYIGPLAPGSYPFFGDFNQDTAKGRIIAK